MLRNCGEEDNVFGCISVGHLAKYFTPADLRLSDALPYLLTMMQSVLLLITAALLQALTITPCNGFSSSLLSSPLHSSTSNRKVSFKQKEVILLRPLYNSENDDVDDSSSPTTPRSLSLEEKMKSWEASEDEIRAATLGGVVPGGSSGGRGGAGGRSDAFDIGLYIAFPIMIIGCLIFAFFPLIVSNIDVSSVGPPPTS